MLLSSDGKHIIYLIYGEPGSFLIETWSIVTTIFFQRICYSCRMRKSLIPENLWGLNKKWFIFRSTALVWCGGGGILNYAMGFFWERVFHGPLGYETHSTYTKPCKMPNVAILKKTARSWDDSSLSLSNYDLRRCMRLMRHRTQRLPGITPVPQRFPLCETPASPVSTQPASTRYCLPRHQSPRLDSLLSPPCAIT